MSNNKQTITIRDVAKEAGVSVSTVSRVLNGKKYIASQTLEKVQRAVRDLGYSSSLAARGMRIRHSNALGLIMPDIFNPYCQLIMHGVNRAIVQLDKKLLLYTTCRGVEVDGQHELSYASLLNGGIVDGVVVVCPIGQTFTSNAPVVIIEPNHANPDYPAVMCTNREGALSAMNYLTGLGHRRIAHISGLMDTDSAVRRIEGYKDGLAVAGIPFDERLLDYGNYQPDQAYLCACRLLALEDRPTAIFVANDMSAIGVYQAIREAGLRIPQEISVVGFDNVRESFLLDPPLTTVDQFVMDMGQIAMEMLVKLINNKKLPNKQHFIETKLIIRGSCCPPQQSRSAA